MSNLTRVENLPGPALSGKVSVSLAEIDKLRADYVKAVNLAKELALNEKEVRVVIVPGDSSKNRFVKDNNVREEVFYKGLDEFREIIRQEEFDKLKSEIEQQQEYVKNAEANLIRGHEAKAEAERKFNNLITDYNEKSSRLRIIEEDNKKLAEKASFAQNKLEEERSEHSTRLQEIDDEYQKLVKDFDVVKKELEAVKSSKVTRLSFVEWLKYWF